MGTGENRISAIGDIEFRGHVGRNIAAYAKSNQRLAHDFAQELVNGAEAAEKAMRKLDGHPLLLGVDVRLRAKRVARKLRKGQDLALALSAEIVKFNVQYRREFLDVHDGSKQPKSNRSVDL
jgi:hypothetical protein